MPAPARSEVTSKRRTSSRVVGRAASRACTAASRRVHAGREVERGIASVDARLSREATPAVGPRAPCSCRGPRRRRRSRSRKPKTKSVERPCGAHRHLERRRLPAPQALPAGRPSRSSKPHALDRGDAGADPGRPRRPRASRRSPRPRPRARGSARPSRPPARRPPRGRRRARSRDGSARSTSERSCETKTSVLPARSNSENFSSARCAKASSPTASTSSTRKHVRIAVRGDREAQPDGHARGVGLDRRLEELLDAREAHDRRRSARRSAAFVRPSSRPVISTFSRPEISG